MNARMTLPIVLVALVAIASAGMAGATDTPPKHTKSKQGTTTVHRQEGADGAVDSTVNGPKGGVTTTDRTRNADGTVDATITKTK